MTILLSNFQPFAAGGTRRVFVHPLDSNKCIKVVVRKADCPLRPLRRRIGVKLFGESYFNENNREIRGYAYLARLENPDIWRHIPQFYGTVQTDLGDGVVTQLLRDYDGGISRTLQSRLSVADGGGYDYNCRESVAEFFKFFSKNKIFVCDTSLQNLLSVRIAPGRERLYIVDGLGGRTVIPLQRHFPPARNAGLRRKHARLNARIAEFLHSQE